MPATEFRGVEIEARLRVELAYRREDCAQDGLQLEVTNRGMLPISARDFAAVVEDVEPYVEDASSILPPLTDRRVKDAG